MGSPNDSVIICEEKKTKSLRRNPVRQVRKGSNGSVINSTDNFINVQSRVPLRTVYESSSRQNEEKIGCYNLSISNKRKRVRRSEQTSPRKRRKTIDLCETIVLSDDDDDDDVSDDKTGNQDTKVTPLSRASGTSDVLLLTPFQKNANRKNKFKHKKGKRQRRKNRILMTKKSVRGHNPKDEDDVAVIWTSSANEADATSEKTDTNEKKLFFFDTVGDVSNFHKRSLYRSTKYNTPGQSVPILEEERYNDNAVNTPSTSQTPVESNQPLNPSTDSKKLVEDINNGNDKNQKELLSRPLREIIVDGLNVTYGYTRKKEVFSKIGLQLVLNYFRSRGHEVKIFLPQHKRSREREFLEDWYRKGYVIFTPSRKIGGKQISSYDDRFILDYATKCKGIVVSSDQYRDLWKEKPEWRETIELRLLIPTFVGDYIMFPEDPLGRLGPTLNEFLRH